jgi:hypothetical protein
MQALGKRAFATPFLKENIQKDTYLQVRHDIDQLEARKPFTKVIFGRQSSTTTRAFSTVKTKL